jgi:hypothetical protein
VKHFAELLELVRNPSASLSPALLMTVKFGERTSTQASFEITAWGRLARNETAKKQRRTP